MRKTVFHITNNNLTLTKKFCRWQFANRYCGYIAFFVAMLKTKILLIACILAALTGCKSIKKTSASSTNHTRKNTRKNVEFIDGVAMTPGAAGSGTYPNYNTNRAKKQRVTFEPQTLRLTTFNIEKADWLQLKYAIMLDATVEKLTNLNLLKDIDYWWGTPYCMGGSGESCIDCSSFSQSLMSDVFNRRLPRTAQQQYDSSEHIDVEDLQEGDLVFFHTTGRGISHVGVYLLNNKFVHAATSGGVMISDLNDSYWRPRYKGAGRYL